MRLPASRSCRALAAVLLCCGCAVVPEQPNGIPWGTPVDGFVVALSLDKEVYRVGDAVHVHLACSRLTGDWTALSVNDSLCNAEIVLSNEDGSPVIPVPPSNPNGLTECIYPGGSRRSDIVHVQQGVVLIEDSFRHGPLSPACIPEGFFQRPGVYTTTAVWHVSRSAPDQNISTRSRAVTVRVAAD
jgi:hypothetical protein